jgi:hypothetical protein
MKHGKRIGPNCGVCGKVLMECATPGISTEAICWTDGPEGACGVANREKAVAGLSKLFRETLERREIAVIEALSGQPPK